MNRDYVLGSISSGDTASKFLFVHAIVGESDSLISLLVIL
jgi:hypothetical protein